MAAGLGFKTFTTGEVLTAADVNGYLMQGVLVFASAAARNAAITSPQEGQFAFTKDTNGLWYYDGAAWVASGATGDIEGVTAGVGITGGGTSGTVTITNDMATTITAAGDIVVGTGSGTYDNLPIGTTNQILTADTTVSPYKVKWATPAASSSGMTLISTNTLTSAAASITFSSISGSYQHLKLVLSGRGSNASNNVDNIQIRLNSDSGSNYRSIYMSGFSTVSVVDGGTTTYIDARYICAGVPAADRIGTSEMTLFDYKSTTLKKAIQFVTTTNVDSPFAAVGQGVWNNTAAVTNIQLYLSSGNFITGTTVSLYGMS